MSATVSAGKGVAEAAAPEVRVRVWDLPLRLFHWLLVLSVALAFVSSEEDSTLNQWHVIAGWVAGMLIVFRLVWGIVGGEHSRFADFVRPSRIGDHVRDLLARRRASELGHNPLGGMSVLILLGLTAVTVGTGAFGGDATKDVHEIAAWTLLGFVGLHIAAVVIMSLLEGENLAKAMITGSKPAHRHPGARNARRPTLKGLLVAFAVLAASVYAILSYDPKAFTLRTAEAFEQGTPIAGHQPSKAAGQRDED